MDKHVLIKGQSMDEWIAEETRKRESSLWGVKYEIQPVICSKILGDGLQLVYLGTIDQRPHYWLIRIDSKTDLSSINFNIETLLEPLEEEFGRYPEIELSGSEEFWKLKKSKDRMIRNKVRDWTSWKQYDSDCQYPALWWSGGHWGMVVNFGTGNIGY